MYGGDEDDSEYELAEKGQDAAKQQQADTAYALMQGPQKPEDDGGVTMQQMAPLIAVVAQAMARKQQQEEAKRRKRAGMLAAHGGSLGAPTFGVEAVRFGRDLEAQPGPDYLSAALQYGRR